MIRFADDEHLLHIQGRMDVDAHLNRDVVVSLTITTNKQAYGPYGAPEAGKGRFGPVYLDGALGFLAGPSGRSMPSACWMMRSLEPYWHG
ncbi:MAG: jacalin-like lectin [Thiolinea sp.]